MRSGGKDPGTPSPRWTNRRTSVDDAAQDRRPCYEKRNSNSVEKIALGIYEKRPDSWVIYPIGALACLCVGIACTQVTPYTRLSRDDEESRMLAGYEESRAREHAASRLLYPSKTLSHPAYMAFVSDLRIIRTECNTRMLAVRAYHDKRHDQLIVAQNA